jgi:hypothetical protein
MQSRDVPGDSLSTDRILFRVKGNVFSPMRFLFTELELALFL